MSTIEKVRRLAGIMIHTTYDRFETYYGHQSYHSSGKTERFPMMHAKMRRKNNNINKTKEAKKNMKEGISNRINGGGLG